LPLRVVLFVLVVLLIVLGPLLLGDLVMWFGSYGPGPAD